MDDIVEIGVSVSEVGASAYADGMVVSVAEVAAELRRRLPGVPTKKLHKLLYYCQGHHLAAFTEPLFSEAVSAFDMGPVVGSLWHREKDGEVSRSEVPLTEAQLNTIGYVVSRYGKLTGYELELLTHEEEPWRRADRDRPSGGRVRIEREWLRDYFRSERNHEAAKPPHLVLQRWQQLVAAEGSQPQAPDTVEALKARLGRRG